MDPVSVMHNNVNSLQWAMYVVSGLNLFGDMWNNPCDITKIKSFNVIIVGGGSAGCVLAGRLSEDPNIKVLLIEAGSKPQYGSMLPATMIPTKRTSMDWNYTFPADNVCIADNTFQATRGRVLGGTSSLNYQFYCRGRPSDFDNWAKEAKDDSWRYENVLPYFMRSENLMVPDINKYSSFHGEGGPIGVTKLDYYPITKEYLKAFEELGHKVLYDANSNDTVGYCEPMTNIANGVRQSSALGYIVPAYGRSNLFVLTDTQVTKILFDKHNVAYGVEAVDSNGKELTFYADDEVVLCAGAINSPQLLMLSGVGPKEHLEELGIKVIADLPVGKNLQDHKALAIVHTMGDESPSPPFNPHLYPSATISGYGYLNESDCTSPAYHNYNLHMNADALLQFISFAFTFSDAICNDLYKQCVGKDVLFSAIYLTEPKSRGEIKLRDTNPFSQPIIITPAYSDENDFKEMVAHVKQFSKVTKTKYFKSKNAKLLVLKQCAQFGENTDEYWACYVKCFWTTLYHYCCGCGLGTVLNSDMTLRKTQKLRVVDTSSMPLITSCNTNAPAMMLAERAADLIKESCRKNRV